MVDEEDSKMNIAEASMSGQGATRPAVELAMDAAADENVLEGEWSPLRVHLIEAIRLNIQSYLSAPAPRPSTPPSASASQAATTSATSSMLLSSSPGTGPTHDEMNDPALQPSTPGGLVLPPFPARTPGETRGTNGVPFMDNQAGIGGKTLPGWMEDRVAIAEGEEVVLLLEGFTEKPPFTLQRLAELARSPMTHHKTVGKYLRALERILLVTSEWEPSDPSLASSSFTPTAGSTVPLGSTTPMFSPIPFLVRPDSNSPSLSSSAGAHADVPPSPLVLDSARSPTPEPETSQPFTGVVDELDAGPSSSSGKGEGGVLAPHAIAIHPTAISSTTTISPEVEERKVAPLPTSKLGDRFVKAGESEEF